MTEFYGSGRFCSRSCACSRNITPEIKNKISKGVKQHNKEEYLKIKICENCGKEYHSYYKTSTKCNDCMTNSIKSPNGNKNATSILHISKRTISKIMNRMNLDCS